MDWRMQISLDSMRISLTIVLVLILVGYFIGKSVNQPAIGAVVGGGLGLLAGTIYIK